MYCPRGRSSSVRFGNQTRIDKAKKQIKKDKVNTAQIIDIVNNCLVNHKIPRVSNPVIKLDNGKFMGGTKPSEFYRRYKEKNNLLDVADIVWMKFTKSGFLGVVACSNDVNFWIPNTKKDYYGKKWNTAGILLHILDEEWDESFVLMFPLTGIEGKKVRHLIEEEIGNCLIEADVPIIDYYSHRY